MDNLKKSFPVFFSERFWGIVLTALAFWLNEYGFAFSAEALKQFILIVTGGSTSVGVLDNAMKKIGKKK